MRNKKDIDFILPLISCAHRKLAGRSGQRNLFSQQPHSVSEYPIRPGVELGEREHFKVP